MKARVKATHEILAVRVDGIEADYRAENGKLYWEKELDFNVPDEPDYWEKLKHQYAGMAMQGILSNQDYCKLLIDENQIGSFAADVSRCAKDFAHALVEKMKEAFKTECE